MIKIPISTIRNAYFDYFKQFGFKKKSKFAIKEVEVGLIIIEVEKSTFGNLYSIEFGICFQEFDEMFFTRVKNEEFPCHIFFSLTKILDFEKRKLFISEILNYTNKTLEQVNKDVLNAKNVIVDSKLIEILNLISTYQGFLQKYKELGYKDFFMTFSTRYKRPEDFIALCERKLNIDIIP